jgi:hypothetical protein
MDFAISADQISNLAAMLDPELQKRREAGEGAIADRSATQLCGYSLSEAVDKSKNNNNKITFGSGEDEGDTIIGEDGQEKKAKPTGAPQNPGFISLPPKLAHQQEAQQEGLPVPSNTHEGRELAKKIASESEAGSLLAKKKKPQGNAIWDADEVDPSFGAGAGEKEIAPSRQAPEYSIMYKHNVSAEDRFLGMDFTRDGSANTADGIVLKIELPKQSSAKDIDLDVKEMELSLLSPLYALRAPLPMKVLTDKGIGAQWDKAKHTLTVTLSADKSKRDFLLV